MMNETLSKLQIRSDELESIRKKLQHNLQKAPEGQLRIKQRGKNYHYFHRTNPDENLGKYIRRENIQLAKALAQRDYDMKALKTTEKELRTLTQFLTSYPRETVNDVYSGLTNSRKNLVTPIEITNEEYAIWWQEQEYSQKEFIDEDKEYYTDNNERVRSKSEIIIANALAGANIPYRYEASLILRGLGTIHPDFTVLKVRTREIIYWEHLGRMDEKDYSEKAIERINAYEKNGVFPGKNLILTYETAERPLNVKLLKEIIEHYLL